ncbi:(+)-neomenthol dehydrogenase [Apostasia shenzhenica]|uniref:(+)-neomenthol dehydrogenase n=1 Tax=Apostasia shenzhenica TaxID=1088818 RepID=A0A2I0BGM6_9ASPA|nr:(+)-neomenthol dehydrogenase [Apostasia shenzhenica]
MSNSNIAAGGLCAVVTGANKGIGLEVVRQLAGRGVSTVVLTSRDESLGVAAVRSLHSAGLPNVIFHRLDVRDHLSISSLAIFLSDSFGKLDILVNNAGHTGVVVDVEGLKALNIDLASWLSGKATEQVQGVVHQNLENAEICLDTNYFGVKRVTEALLPLLRKSPSGARIVNVSSRRSELKSIPSEKIRKELSDAVNLNEEKIEELLGQFLRDLKEGKLDAGGWPRMLPAYSMSKMALNAYTRVLARRWPEMYVNCVHPGFIKTDFNLNTGAGTTEEGARGPVMLALLPDGGPSGRFFHETIIAPDF